jgi:hypothetical protein
MRRLTPAGAGRNVRRCFRLDVQPDLPGAWCCVWGCIGPAGQTRSIPYSIPLEAQAALDQQRRRKELEGYITASAGGDG